MDSDYIINHFKQCPSNLVFESKLTSRFTEGLSRESSSQYIVFTYILPGVSNISSGNLPIIFFIFIATIFILIASENVIGVLRQSLVETTNATEQVYESHTPLMNT